MSLTVSDGGKDFAPAPSGTHLAICYQVVDLGTQLTPFKDDKTGEPKSSRQVYISWELCNEPMEDGRAFSVGSFYTASLNEKANLRHHLDSWRGKVFTEEELAGFHLKNILGKACMVNVAHATKKDGTTSAKVAGVVSVPRGMTIPAQANPSVVFEIDPDNWDDVKYKALPEWLQKIIAKSEEFTAKFGKAVAPDAKATPAASAGLADDMSDIPFNHLSAPCGV